MAGITSRGRINVRQVKAEPQPRVVVRREGWGRKALGLKVGQGFLVGPNITVVRVDGEGCRLAIIAPLSVAIGDVEEISLG